MNNSRVINVLTMWMVMYASCVMSNSQVRAPMKPSDKTFCSNRSISLIVPKDAPIEVMPGPTIQSGIYGTFLNFTFSNRSQKVLQRISASFQLIAADKSVIARFYFESGAGVGKRLLDSLMPYKSHIGISSWETPVKPGETSKLVVDSPVVSSDCGTEVSFDRLQLEFSDGSEFKSESNDWVIDTNEVVTLDEFEFALFEKTPAFTLAKVEISGKGKVSVRSLAKGSKGITSLRRTFSHIWFSPIVVNGKATSSEKLLLILPKEECSPIVLERVRKLVNEVGPLRVVSSHAMAEGIPNMPTVRAVGWLSCN